MNRLEIIHARLTSNYPSGLFEDIHCSMAAAGVSLSVRVYQHATVAGDICIHLGSQTESADTQPSDLGIHIAEALRDHGMVEHAVWLELLGDDDDPDGQQGAEAQPQSESLDA
jgi:hypothetical protein